MRTKKAMLNISAGLVSLVATTVLGMVSSGLFARKLGVEISGLNNVMINVISFLSVTELGIAGSINYNLYKPVLEKDYDTISRIMTFFRKSYMIIGAVITVASLILSGFIYQLLEGTTLSKEYVQISFLLCAGNTILSYFLAYNRNILYAFQENYLQNLVDLFFRVICTVIQIICLIKFQNFQLHLTLNLIYTFFSNLIITLIVKKKYSQITTRCKVKDKTLQKKVMHDVKSLSIIQIGSAMINFTSSLIISKKIGIIVAGMYAYYASLITILNNLINMIFSNLGAGIGNLLAENNKKNSNKVFRSLSHFCFLLGLIIASGLGNAIEPFIEMWVGAEYILNYSVVVVLALNFYIMVQRQVVTYFLRTGGYHDLMVKPLVLEAIINLSVSIFLATKLGLIGVFIGVGVSSLVGWPLNAKTLTDVLGISFKKYIGKQTAYLVLFVVQLFVSHFVIEALDLQCGLLLRFLISGVISVTIPLIVSVLDVRYNPELESIREMIGKLFKKFFRLKKV